MTRKNLGKRDRNMETLLRQLLDLVTEQAEITESRAEIIREELPTIRNEARPYLERALGVVEGREQILRAIEALLMDYTK